jgi:hypothetical protein
MKLSELGKSRFIFDNMFKLGLEQLVDKCVAECDHMLRSKQITKVDSKQILSRKQTLLALKHKTIF